MFVPSKTLVLDERSGREAKTGGGCGGRVEKEVSSSNTILSV